MRDALGTLHGGRVVRHNDVFRIHRFRHGAVAQRAEVHFLERQTTEAQHEQHLVRVGVVFVGGNGQVVIKVAFKVLGQLVVFERVGRRIIADFHGAVCGQQL